MSLIFPSCADLFGGLGLLRVGLALFSFSPSLALSSIFMGFSRVRLLLLDGTSFAADTGVFLVAGLDFLLVRDAISCLSWS